MDFYMPRVVYRPARYYYPAAPARRYNNHVPFLSLLDDTFNELNRVSKCHYRRPAAPAPRFVNQRFDIRETNEAYQVEGELPGFDRSNIEIEFTDEKTLVVRGKSERKSEATTTPQASLNAPEQEQKTLLEKPTAPEEEEEEEAPAARLESETGSVKSYQASVEDDYEDLGSDYTPPPPTSSSSDKATTTESVEAVQQPPQPAPEPKEELAPQQVPQERNWVSERSFGSFTRTFRFPVRVNTDAVTAKFNNGVLSISVPKATAPGVRHILIA